jgi:hypothetical protein
MERSSTLGSSFLPFLGGFISKISLFECLMSKETYLSSVLLSEHPTPLARTILFCPSHPVTSSDRLEVLQSEDSLVDTSYHTWVIPKGNTLYMFQISPEYNKKVRNSQSPSSPCQIPSSNATPPPGINRPLLSRRTMHIDCKEFMWAFKSSSALLDCHCLIS